jgi:uncharacterized protein (DUF2252 family)
MTKSPSPKPVALWASPAERPARLSALRNAKMTTSAHAYVRGSVEEFYDWLGRADGLVVPEGPPVWICGDCHVGNLGPVGSVKGAIDIEIRDFDQSVIGNPAHDLLRLGLSLAMAARASDLPGITTAQMLEQMMVGYAEAFDELSHDRGSDMPDLVRHTLHEAAGRSWKHLADERIEGTAPTIPLGKRFWPLKRVERDAVHSLFAEEDMQRLVTGLGARDEDAAIKVLDAAYWRKGCSSLGLLRLAVLVEIKSGADRQHCLMDIKEAIAPAAPHGRDARMPRDNAERVVEGARHMSPHLGNRMLACRLMDKAVFVRELLPQDLKLEIETLTREEAMSVARFLAKVVGRAHARQMGTLDGGSWIEELQRSRSKKFDAPSWLWTGVVELVGPHERAYLEHCRRYALAA